MQKMADGSSALIPLSNDANITKRKKPQPKSKDNCESGNDNSDDITITLTPDELAETPPWGLAILNLLNISLKSLNDKATATCNLMTSYVDTIESVSTTANSALTLAKKNKTDMETLSKKVDKLADDLSRTKDENDKLKEHILKNESYSRRENLVFRGFVAQHSCEKTIRNILQKMNIPGLDSNTVPFVRCHYTDKAKSHIIVRFLMFSDRELVWNNRRSLQTVSKDVFMSEDFPPEIERRRKELYPIANAANRLHEYKQKATVSGDKLIINSKTYKSNTLHTLPSMLRPRALAERSDDNILVFGGVTSNHHPLSNFYKKSFVLDDVTFSCSEQAFQFQKAILFGDQSSADRILKETYPASMRYFGKHVKGYRDDVWKRERDNVMMRVLRAKFGVNELSELLVNTGVKTLAEANSRDSYWAIGLPIIHGGVLNRNLWATNGNTLGKLLMTLRQELAAQ